MLTTNFLRGRRRHELTPAELETIENSICEVREIPARKTVLRAGQRPDESIFLIDGFMARHHDDNDGDRQILALHLPGDFIGLHSYALGYVDHDTGSLGACKVGVVQHARLREIQQAHPRIAHYLWLSTLLDAALHREWIFRQGRLDALGRIAHFFAETEQRLAFLGLTERGRFQLPLVQLDLADVTGVTLVHLNRCLAKLRSEQIADFRDGTVIIHDRPALHALGGFHHHYLM